MLSVMNKFLFFLSVLLVILSTPRYAFSTNTKWTIAYRDGLFYGGVAVDLAPISKQPFGAIESVWLEHLLAFKMFDVDKTPLFAGLSVAFRFKPTDTGFQGGLSVGASWIQETERIKPYLSFSVMF